MHDCLDAHRLLPVVLTGGRSVRFGRDKLREPHAGGRIIDAPIRALTEILPRPLAFAGQCHPDLVFKADVVIPDEAPHAGPIGGLMAALRHPLGCNGICVLAGDLAYVTSGEVRSLVAHAAAAPPGIVAVLGRTDRPEPCIGVYRPGALQHLEHQFASGRSSLHDAIPAALIAYVAIDGSRARNVNRPRDLDS